MAKYTRKQFLKMSGAIAAGVGAGSLPAWAAGSAMPVQSLEDIAGPDLAVVNGRIYTMDASRPTAEALAVKNGRFVAVGSSDDIRNLANSQTEVIDAEQMTVTPGFIDAHCHPASGGVREIKSVNLDLRSMAEIYDALRKRAGETPAGEWVLGFKYDDTKVKEGRQITIHDLDEAVPHHPTFVSHRGGHVYWYNTKAFELAGVTANTPDPPGGHIYKDNGELNGKVAERANALFSDVRPSGSTRQERQAGVKLISELMTAAGLTSVTDAGVNQGSGVAYQDAYNAGEMRFRVYMMLRGDFYEHLKEAGIYTGFGDEWLKVGPVKFGADGSASGRTMAMTTPYVGRPDDYGILTMTQEEIHEAVEEAHRHRFQIGIHANGDKTIDMVLKAYERMEKIAPRQDPRHRIEHCSLVNPDLLKRIKATGSIPTPFHTYAHYHGNKWVEYGEEKMRWMFAHRSFLDYGIPVASGSDYVPGPFEPLMAIQSMVTRKDMKGRIWGPNQKVTVDEALKICTTHAAYASFEENLKGSITAGKLGDFVILAKDPHDTDPDHIKEIEVVRTVVGGKTMHPKTA